MDLLQVETLIKGLIGEYSWIFIMLFISLFLREVVHNWIVGLFIFMGNDINADDILYVSGRAARVVRQTPKSPILYMTDSGTKMIVPNEKLKELTIEKKLPKNGKPYLKKEYAYDIRKGYNEENE